MTAWSIYEVVSGRYVGETYATTAERAVTNHVLSLVRELRAVPKSSKVGEIIWTTVK